MEQTTMIDRPWVIAHTVATDDGDKLQVILAGEDGGSVPAFGIVIADIISHVAAHFAVSKAEVMEWVQKEIDNPTSDLKRMLNS